MKSLFYSCICLGLPLALSAQPTVNRMEDLAAGDKFRMVNCSDTLIAPGPSGASQTWNFTYLHPMDTTTTWVLAASAAPDGSKFPKANLAYYDRPGSWTYVAKNGASSFIMGVVDSNYLGSNVMTAFPGRRYVYADSMLFARRPIRYGDLLSENFGSAISDLSGSSPLSGGGPISVMADGWGTLQLPGGATYVNVLRIKTELQEKDSITYPFVARATNTKTIYSWYSDAAANPLLVISVHTMIGATTTNTRRTTSYYLNPNLAVGNVASAAAALQGAFRNGSLYLNGPFEAGKSYNLSITDLAGRKLVALAFTGDQGPVRTDAGSHLPAGLYLITVHGMQGGRAAETLKVVKTE